MPRIARSGASEYIKASIADLFIGRDGFPISPTAPNKHKNECNSAMETDGRGTVQMRMKPPTDRHTGRPTATTKTLREQARVSNKIKTHRDTYICS